jgi:hypothetical protein
VPRGKRAPRRPRPDQPAVAAAFDVLRFGRENTLDLRSSLPTGAEAARRAEAFLRERQVSGAEEVLVITGRGNQSADGIPVVRPTVAAVLARLRRRGVVAAWTEHTPGAFAVTPAPVRALLDSPRRHGDRPSLARPNPEALAAFEGETRALLRRLAERSLHLLGAPASDAYVEDEMMRQFSVLGASIPPGVNRERQLRAAAAQALAEMDELK